MSEDQVPGRRKPNFCDPCKYDNDQMIAKGYCNTCKEYLCQTCLKVHQKQSLSRNHNISGQKQVLNKATKKSTFRWEKLLILVLIVTILWALWKLLQMK